MKNRQAQNQSLTVFIFGMGIMRKVVPSLPMKVMLLS